MKIFTDLNLHENTPVRVQPQTGEWGPTQVMSTGSKKRARILWPVGFVAAATALFVFGHWIFGIIMNVGG
ncbi:MAG: hypothetical protein LBN10_03050 [Propionibacteriaceae bacterium]|nr:hypothetical protein [Propionibacteriaceae bacterium]